MSTTQTATNTLGATLTRSARVMQASSPTGTPRPAVVRGSLPQRLLMSFLVLGVGVVAVAGGWRWWLHSRSWTMTDNAYVSAHIHTVSPRVAGTVEEVLVQENQVVTQGAVLARLDRRDLEVRQQQAQAQLAQARAQHQQGNALVAQARAQVARERARTTKAQGDLDRARSLYEGASGTISKQELDQVKAEADAAQAGLEGAAAALKSAEAQAAAAQAQEQAAWASLREADLQLSYTEIVAAASGRIGKKNLEAGNRVQPGQALLALVESERWITANFKETQFAGMRPGQLVRIRLDAFSGHTFSGKVESLSPASGAQFALLPPDNATGNFTRIVQRVPVKIVFDAASVAGWEDRIVSGMSAIVEVKVRE